MSSLPSGTVTFLFTDIEGSTKFAQELPEMWEFLRERHHSILRGAIEANHGYVFQVIGDAFCAAFHSAMDGLGAAIEAQRNLQSEDWGDTRIKVRMGIHTGEAVLQANGDYQGYLAMSRVQRLMSAGHGGQVLVSAATQELIRDNLPKGIGLHDLGEKRLKDLIRPEHIYQLAIPNLPDDFPPLRTLDIYRHNLPSQLTSFVGREKEIAEIKNELKDHRLVTLTGSGGTGKTRLSLQVAVDLLDTFPDGVWFVELAPITDPEIIVQTIHTTLGLFEQQRKSFLQMLVDFLREKKVLLLLDNCEHLIEACAQVADTLLTHSTALKILASSREALGVKGELAWRVPSLSLPDPTKIPELNELNQYEAVRLFIYRAILANPHFALTNDNARAVVQICHRLDGIPLALELAAARIKTLSGEQISERLDDRFRLLTGGARTALPRQQTLRALIDWSYNLLSAKEKTLFRRLAVFAGGWTLETAEAVCSDESIDSLEVLDLLSNLVDKSLITTEESDGVVRYRRLETIRQYAREKFFETEEVQAVRNRHLVWVVDWAEKMAMELEGKNQAIRLKQIKKELDNIRSAIEWGLGSHQVESSMRIVSGLAIFWDGSHPYQETRQWVEKGLAARQDLTDRTLARTLLVAAWLAYHQNRMEAAERHAEESLSVAGELQDKQLLANALRAVAGVHLAMGRFSEYDRYNKEARLIYQELGNNEELTALAGGEILTLIYQNDIPGAARLANEYAGAYAEMEAVSQAWFYLIFGYLKASEGDLEQGTNLVRKSLLLFQQLDHVYWIGNCLAGFARVANAQGDPVRAARLLGARNAIHESIGAASNPQSQQLFTTITEQTKSMLDEETFQSAWEEGKAMAMEQAVAYALEESTS